MTSTNNVRPILEQQQFNQNNQAPPNPGAPLVPKVVVQPTRDSEPFTYGACDLLPLALTTIASFRSGNWTSRQIQARDAFFEWAEGWEGSRAGVQPMNKLVSILSDIFFRGRLHEIKFRWKNNLVSKEGYTLRATTQFFDEVGVAHINLDPRDWAEDLGVRSRRDAVLGLLLHECVHAFLGLYGREPESTSRDGRTSGDCADHGRAWFHLAANMQGVARAMLNWDVRLDAFRYGEEYTPTAIDWRDYYQQWRFQCPFDFTWPLKSYGESAAINDLVRLSIKKDPEARNILRQAADAHRQTAVASVMANDKAVWLFLEDIPLKVLQGPQAGEPWLTNEEMEKFKTLAARVYCEDYPTPRLSWAQPSEIPGTYSHLLDAEGRLYRGL
ncbi:hypothetical protein LTS10_008656 [Elasticomyces elasticus]|nr:hypothetical protein LTS10_008656 [Elasticomyces elasticus]